MNIETRITTIASKNTELVSLLESHSTAARQQTCSLLALVYELGRDINAADDEAEFIQALNDRSILAPKNGENVWGKIIPMTCGKWTTDDKGVRSWTKNASLDKYARALRLMDERNVSSEQAANFMMTFAEGENRLLDGMIAADKLNHPAQVRGIGDKAQLALNRAVQQLSEGRIELDGTKHASQPGQVFSRAYGYFEGQDFVLMGFLPDSEKAAQLDAAKAGKELK